MQFCIGILAVVSYRKALSSRYAPRGVLVFEAAHRSQRVAGQAEQICVDRRSIPTSRRLFWESREMTQEIVLAEQV